MTTAVNAPGEPGKNDQSANEQPSQGTGKDNQNGAAGEDEQAADVNLPAIGDNNENSGNHKAGVNEDEGKFREDD